MMRIWLAGVVAGVSLAAGADVWEVSTTVPDGDGLTGVHALTNAIAKACAATGVKTIRLGPGTYDLSTLSERAFANSWGTACSYDGQGVASLLVGAEMTFEGTDPTPWAKKTSDQETVLKGSGAMRIFYGYSGSGRACVFRHLTFDGGHAGEKLNGGAIMFSGTEFGGYATNCVFRNCSALTGGATHDVTAWSCLYENNTASKGGGAFGTQANTSAYRTNSFDNCVFRYNKATGTGGGGLYAETIDRLNGVTFIGNTTTGSSGAGGGIFALSGNPIVDRCLFVSNTCKATERNFQAPGLSRFRDCTFTGRFGLYGSDFERCTFENCESTVNDNTEGFLTVNADGRIANCLFANCRAVKLIANIGHRLDVANCTFADSAVSGYVFWTFRNGGTNIDYTGIPATNEIVNCIFAGNTVAGAAKDVNFYVTGTGVPKASANFVNNIVYMRDEGGVWANVTDGQNFKKVADVKFVGADNADYPAAPKYMILRDSPAFDAGIRQAWMTGASDLAGKPRIFGKEVDIGCYECDLSPLSYLFLFD